MNVHSKLPQVAENNIIIMGINCHNLFELILPTDSLSSPAIYRAKVSRFDLMTKHLDCTLNGLIIVLRLVIFLSFFNFIMMYVRIHAFLFYTLGVSGFLCRLRHVVLHYKILDKLVHILCYVEL